MGICDSNGADLLVEYSDEPDKTWNDATHTWNDVRSESGVLEVTGGDKPLNEVPTFGGPVANVGQRTVHQVALNVLFSNSTTSFLEFLTDTWDGTDDKCFYLRWSYNSGASGALRRTAKVALLTNPFTGGDPAGTVTAKNLTFAVDGIINRDTVA